MFVSGSSSNTSVKVVGAGGDSLTYTVKGDTVVPLMLLPFTSTEYEVSLLRRHLHAHALSGAGGHDDETVVSLQGARDDVGLGPP